MINQTRTLALTAVFIAVILAVIMLHLTGLIPSMGEWYSYDPVFRLQTEAFGRGELTIQPVPYGHHHDWVWGNGAHQVWGLGVPIIQFPFQLVGKFVNSFGFPERLIFVIFYGVVATLFCFSINVGVGTHLSPKERLKRYMQIIPLLVYALLHHGFIAMIRGRFDVYEEVVSYAFLWALMLFALLLIFYEKRNATLYLLLCLLAGFALNIRPTAGAYGGVTFLLAFYLAWQGGIRLRWAGLAFFLSGLLFFLLMNYLRFGSPLEFGHNLCLTGSSFYDYITRFDNPMTWTSFSSLAVELLSALFFLDVEKFQASTGMLPWMAQVPRARDFYFKSFYPVEFFLILLALAIVVGLLVSRERRKSLPHKDFSLLSLGTIWSLGSFSLLFVFYAYHQDITSRYLIDFAAAVIACVTVLYLYLLRLTQRRGLIKWLIPSLGVVLVASMTLEAVNSVSLSTDPSVADIVTAREQFNEARRTTGPALPPEYRCGDKEYLYDIPYNNSGWQVAGDCSVEPVTTHFFDAPRCIAISFSRLAQSDELNTASYYSDGEIEAKIGYRPMKIASATQKDGLKTITFCSTEETPNKHLGYSTIEMVSIKWIDWRKHLRISSNLYRLFSIKRIPY